MREGSFVCFYFEIKFFLLPCWHRAFFRALNSASDKLYVVRISVQSGSLLSLGKSSNKKSGGSFANPEAAFPSSAAIVLLVSKSVVSASAPMLTGGLGETKKMSFWKNQNSGKLLLLPLITTPKITRNNTKKVSNCTIAISSFCRGLGDETSSRRQDYYYYYY